MHLEIVIASLWGLLLFWYFKKICCKNESLILFLFLFPAEWLANARPAERALFFKHAGFAYCEFVRKRTPQNNPLADCGQHADHNRQLTGYFR